MQECVDRAKGGCYRREGRGAWAISRDATCEDGLSAMFTPIDISRNTPTVSLQYGMVEAGG
jgi:hypothetical protein